MSPLRPFCFNPGCPLHGKMVPDDAKGINYVPTATKKIPLSLAEANAAALEEFTVYMFTRHLHQYVMGPKMKLDIFVCQECDEVQAMIEDALDYALSC